MTVDTSDITRIGRLDLIRIIRELEEEIAKRDAQDTSKEIESLKSKLAACAGHDYAKQVNELQARMTAMTNSQLSRRVRAFHQKFDHPVVWVPVVPDEKQVKFRLNLIGEEFFELLAACEIWPTFHVQAFNEEGKEIEIEIKGWEMVKNAIEDDFIDPKVVNFPEFVDALGDMEWVIEGTRAVCGVDGAPIMDEINRANMAKEATQVAEKDAFHMAKTRIKPTKPAGWAPPDVAAELMKQGWVKS